MAIVKAKGIISFNPHQNAPNFVLGTIAISLNQLRDWCETEGKQYLTDYKGEPQLKLQVTSMKEGRGIMIAVDTYKAGQQATQHKQYQAKEETPTTTSAADDDLPF